MIRMEKVWCIMPMATFIKEIGQMEKEVHSELMNTLMETCRFFKFINTKEILK